MVNAYYYLFYSFYNLLADKKNDRVAKTRAGLLMMTLEMYFLFSLDNYYRYFTDSHDKMQVFSIRGILPILLAFALNWFTLIRDSTWQNYVREFDSWSKRKKNIANSMVIIFLLLMVTNCIFSYYVRPNYIP